MVSGSLTRKYDKKDSEEKVVYHEGGGLSSRWSFIKVVVSHRGCHSIKLS